MLPRRLRKGPHENQRSKDAQDLATAMDRVARLPEESAAAMTTILAATDPTFWTMMRKEQVVALARMAEGTPIKQDDIGTVLDVAQCSVSRYLAQHKHHPEMMHPPPGRPSVLRTIFGDIQNFIASEVSDGCSVTMDDVMRYLQDEHGLYVRRKQLWDFLTNQGYRYVQLVPDEAERVNLTDDALLHFYTVDLPNAVDGKHPALVFNMDEMGAERFADRKAVFTFLPPQVEAGRDATLGVSRTSNRCTLVACIALDGTTLMPTVITKTRTVNTNVFEKGYGPENVALFSTKNSFIRVMFLGTGCVRFLSPPSSRRGRGCTARSGASTTPPSSSSTAAPPTASTTMPSSSAPTESRRRSSRPTPLT